MIETKHRLTCQANPSSSIEILGEASSLLTEQSCTIESVTALLSSREIDYDGIIDNNLNCFEHVPNFLKSISTFEPNIPNEKFNKQLKICLTVII